MTPSEFRAWLRRLTLTQAQAARAFGMMRREIPRRMCGMVDLWTNRAKAGGFADMGLRRCVMRRFAMTPAAAMTLTLCFLGGGCVAAVGAGTVVATDKTPLDHVVSLVTGKDCSIVRQHRGLTYCVEGEITPPVRVHCYPTIGEVSCYGEPDPFPGHQRELGSGPAVATAAR